MLPNIFKFIFQPYTSFKILFEANSFECRVGKITQLFFFASLGKIWQVSLFCYVTSFFMQIFKLLENFIEVFQIFQSNSDKNVSLWILRNFWEHLLHRTPPDDCFWLSTQTICLILIKRSCIKITPAKFPCPQTLQSKIESLQL